MTQTSAQSRHSVWTIAEPGARTWREARDMYVNGGLVTAHVDDDQMSVFVGTAMLYTGPIPADMVGGSPEWVDFVRDIATGRVVMPNHTVVPFTSDQGESLFGVWDRANGGFVMESGSPIGFYFEHNARTMARVIESRNV